MARESNSNKRGQIDPHRAGEAKKYDNPIPSREFIIEQLTEYGAPIGFVELAELLRLYKEQDLEALSRRVNAMERDGQVVRNRRGGICVVNHKDLITGRVIGHPDGFGFLKPDDGGEDLFLSPRNMRPLLHGDKAVVRIVGVDRRGRKEGAVVEVLERGNHQVVGRIYLESNVGFVVPDNKRIHQDLVIPVDDQGGAGHGQMVIAEIVEQPNKRSPPIGRVVEVLGDHMAPGMEIDIAIRTHELPVEWPEAVADEVLAFGDEVPAEATQGRVDLRRLPLVTIDGADARDFDDAVYCEKKPKGWKLLVCIADVSAYVMPGSALDREARARGNSVYFPDRVIPMLPEVLSNGLCSLNPDVDRLCMVCEMHIDHAGKITRSRFFEGVMRSHARLTYDKVAAMLLDGDPKLCERYAELLPHLHELYALYQVLHRSRSVRGAIDFDTTETRIIFNDQQKVDTIVPLVRNDAHRLIEECMLAANVAAARFLLRKKLPALFRIHEGPTADRLEDLRAFLAELGLFLAGGDTPDAKDYADLLNSVKDRPDAHLIQTVLLRSMSQAVYSSDNIGHFGLSFPAYTHFTSPIRRYPDLVVHRAIKHLLAGGDKHDFEYGATELETLGEHCSATERRADEATRDVVSWLKCEYMMDKIGESFDGTITSVTSFGIFVELDEIYVDGLVHITSLDKDYYHFDPVGHRLTGERSGEVYRLGDRVRITVAAVNLDERKLDFVLVEKRDSKGAGPAAKRRARKRKAKAVAKAANPNSNKPNSKKVEQRAEQPKKKRKKASDKKQAKKRDKSKNARKETKKGKRSKSKKV
ncbi:MAG: ribonuclease R [Chromatiales bacterium]|nr:ribonuclease R [Chromatiales bacterium]